MMLLISLAITVAFVYSIGTVAYGVGEPFFWELVTLTVIFLLGHWVEMRSVRRASGALDHLADLMPDTAERLTGGGEPETVPVAELQQDDLVLVRPGANVPADGVVEEGESNVNESMLTIGIEIPVTLGSHLIRISIGSLTIYTVIIFRLPYPRYRLPRPVYRPCP